MTDQPNTPPEGENIPPVPATPETPPTPAPKQESRYDAERTASIIARQDKQTKIRTLQRLIEIDPEFASELTDTTPAPREDSGRIAALETELARSKAVTKYGLPEDIANMLDGNPAKIDAMAQALAEKMQAVTPQATPAATPAPAETPATPEPPRPNEPAPVYVERSVPSTQGIPPHEALQRITQRLEEVKAEGGLDMFKDISRRKME